MSKFGLLGEGKLGQGWAPKRENLTSEQRRSNEAAAKTLIALMGGFEGIIANGVSMKDLSWILEADPKDDISGLRSMSECLVPSSGFEKRIPVDDVALEPHIARQFLLKTGRAIVDNDVLMLVDDDRTDHITLAGFAISQDIAPRTLVNAYQEVSTNGITIHPDTLNGIARSIVQDYLSTPPDKLL